MTVADLRVEYTKGGLTEADAGSDPFELFGRWFHEAMKAAVPEPNAMTLATVGQDGQPSVRVVLLKAFDRQGFTFFTNYTSRKSQELTSNPRAALAFFWSELERQVRIEGTVVRATEAESDAYFAARPRLSRLSAWASTQSAVIADRGVLEREMAELEQHYPGDDIPRPPHWGGFRLIPRVIEFWQGRPSRLHDRLRYTRDGDDWERDRLGP